MGQLQRAEPARFPSADRVIILVHFCTEILEPDPRAQRTKVNRAPYCSDAMSHPSPKDNPLHGRVILIVQRAWIIARTLADAFQAKGAQVVMTKNTQSDVVNDS